MIRAARRPSGAAARAGRAGAATRPSCSAPWEKRSARRTPDAHAVLTGGGDALAVGEECHAPDGAGVALVFVHLLAALRIPDAHDAVTVTSPSGDALPAGDNALAVGRERGAIGSAASEVSLLVVLD